MRGGDKAPLLEYLDGLDRSLKAMVEKMMRLLFEHVPAKGPPAWNKEQSRPLGHKLFEFKQDDLRVLYFYDEAERGIVVCTHGFAKKSDKTPRREIDRAKRIKNTYQSAVSRGDLSFVTFDEAGGHDELG